MKFRIIRYYERYKPQILSDIDGAWYDLGEPTGYPTRDSAREACINFKHSITSTVVEEFYL